MDAPQFDVFLSHNSADKLAVEELARRLIKEGIQPWLDKWNLVPGDPWQAAIEEALDRCATCAVFIGPSGTGPWQNEEMRAAIDRRVSERKDRFRVIPVLLPGAERDERSRLPPFLVATTWVEFRHTLEDEEAYYRLVCGIRGIEPGPGPVQAVYGGECPYRGLQVFDVYHAPFFFGREALTEWLLNELRPSIGSGKDNRFLGIIGPSGSGKSSLARAGLVAALKRGEIEGSATWPIAVFRPGANPLESLAVALSNATEMLQAPSAVRGLIKDLHEDERMLHLTTRLALRDAPPERRLALLVDQLEELFTLCHEEPLRQALIKNLLYAASVAGGQTVVLLTLRADFYGECATYPILAAALSDHQVLVGPMTDEELRRAIERPAQLSGCEFEAGLVETLLRDVKDQPGGLPLLQHALLELWERRRGRRLTLEAYRESGGVEEAIAQRAEAIYNEFNPEQQAIARRILLRLTQPGEGTEDTRRRVTMEELEESDAVEAVVHALTDARLLTTSRNEQTGKRWVEVSHEALIRGWPRLRQWLDENRAGRRLHRRLTETAQEWQRLNRDEGVLYHGALLAQAMEWRERNEAELNDLERGFLDASVALQARERCTAQQHKRLTMGGLISALVLISASAFVAFQQRDAALQEANARAAAEKQAVAERDAAERAKNDAITEQKIATSRELATSAVSQLSVDPELSVLLATEAVRVMDTPEAEDALRQSLSESHVRLMLRGHTNVVQGAVFSPDGKFVVTASSADDTSRVWEAATGRMVAVLEGCACIGTLLNDTVFSPDGKFVVTTDREARVWEAATGKAVAVLDGHTDGVETAAFSRDGMRIITTSSDNTARLWDAATGKAMAILHGYKKRHSYDQARFSPDGKLVVMAYGGNTARVWEATTGKPIAELRGHTDRVFTLAFSPDGKYVVTGSDLGDYTARIWEAATGKVVAVLEGHTGGITSAAFSPDGKRVVTASIDGTARVWEANTGKGMAVLQGHTAGVKNAAFSRDGKFIVTASDDGTARVWEATMGKVVAVLRGRGETVNWEATLSPDGKFVVAPSGDDSTTARMWDAGTGNVVAALEGHTGRVRSAKFSPDGKFVFTVGEDKAAGVWDAATGQSRAIISDADSAELSPDGKRVVTVSVDGTARVWEAAMGKVVAVLTGHTGRVRSAKFSGDGKLVFTVGEDKTARVWDAATGESLIIINDANSAAFSPDGKFVASVGWGKIVDAEFSPAENFEVTVHRETKMQVWEVATGKVVAELTSLGEFNYVVFSPDGKLVITKNEFYPEARVWEAATGKVLAVLNTNMISGEASAAFSPDGKKLATVTADNVQVWEVSTGKELRVLRGHTGSVRSAKFSPDGKSVLTTSQDGTARVWEVPGQSIAELREDTGRIGSAEFSPDGKFVVTVGGPATLWLDRSGGGPARLWDPRTGQSLAVLGRPTDAISAEFSPDSRSVLTVNEDGTAQIYACEVCAPIEQLLVLARTRVTRELTTEEREQYLHEGVRGQAPSCQRAVSPVSLPLSPLWYQIYGKECLPLSFPRGHH